MHIFLLCYYLKNDSNNDKGISKSQIDLMTVLMIEEFQLNLLYYQNNYFHANFGTSILHYVNI